MNGQTHMNSTLGIWHRFITKRANNFAANGYFQKLMPTARPFLGTLAFNQTWFKCAR